MNINELKKFGISCPEKGNFIIILGSKWCKSCKLLSSIIKKFRNENLIKFKVIDIGENSKIAQELNIYALPALIFFKDGELLNKDLKFNDEILVKNGVLIGSFNESILKRRIKQI